MRKLRSLLLAALAIPLLPARAAAPPFEEGYALVRQLMSEKDGERQEAAGKLLKGNGGASGLAGRLAGTLSTLLKMSKWPKPPLQNSSLAGVFKILRDFPSL